MGERSVRRPTPSAGPDSEPKRCSGRTSGRNGCRADMGLSGPWRPAARARRAILASPFATNRYPEPRAASAGRFLEATLGGCRVGARMSCGPNERTVRRSCPPGVHGVAIQGNAPEVRVDASTWCDDGWHAEPDACVESSRRVGPCSRLRARRTQPTSAGASSPRCVRHRQRYKAALR